MFFLVYLTPSALFRLYSVLSVRNVLANLDFIFRNWKRVFVENVKDFVVDRCFVAVVLESFQLCLLLHTRVRFEGIRINVWTKREKRSSGELFKA